MVPGWTNALFNEPTSLKEFSGLNIPVLYMVGKDSPASSRGVARLLTQVLPRVQVIEFEGLGHMGPVTHPEAVNEAVCHFLEHRADAQEPASLPLGRRSSQTLRLCNN
jgi:pimeloyl-ACP methyl ester carboxylesterase